MPNSLKPSGATRTVAAVLNEAARRLAAASPSARLDAEVLLAHVLGKSRAYLKAWPEFVLNDEWMNAYEWLVSGRARGVPVAYLTGRREFWSRDFLVSPEVLIPRPETELLVRLALDALTELARATILDLGTGSGAIAITLAKECPGATLYGCDLSAAALGIARLNSQRHGATNLRLVRSNWLAGFAAAPRFDVIVANPPYVRDDDPHLTEGDVRFEPGIALRAGEDGLDAIHAIAEQARSRLKPSGLLLLEHGYDQAQAVGRILRHHGYGRITHHADLQGHLRVTGAWWKA